MKWRFTIVKWGHLDCNSQILDKQFSTLQFRVKQKVASIILRLEKQNWPSFKATDSDIFAWIIAY